MFRKRLNTFKGNIKSATVKNKVLYSSDKKILSALNNIMLLVNAKGHNSDAIAPLKAEFLQALNMQIPVSAEDECCPVSCLLDECEIDIDRQEILTDEVFI